MRSRPNQRHFKHTLGWGMLYLIGGEIWYIKMHPPRSCGSADASLARHLQQYTISLVRFELVLSLVGSDLPYIAPLLTLLGPVLACFVSSKV